MSIMLPINKVVESVSITHKFDKPVLKFLNTSDVENGKIINVNHLPIDELKGQAKKTIKRHDILFSEIRPKNRRFAYVDIDDTYDFVVSTKLMVLRNINQEVDNKYFYYFLTNDHMLSILQDRAENRIGSFPQITFDLLSEYYIRVPSLSDQQKIASVLSALDSKIELNNSINAELEALAKTIYDYWFVQFDFPDKNGKPYKSSGGKMVWNDNLKREIPEGWEVQSLFTSAQVQYGFPFSTEFFNEEGNGNPVIRIRDILENSISNYSTQKDIDEKYRLEKGDLLIGMDGNFHINYWSKENCYLNQRVVRIRKKELSNMLIRYQIEPFIELRERSVSRTTVGHLSDKDLKAIHILVPEIKTKEIVTVLFDNFLKKIITNQQQSQQLSNLRDWLLPMLMNGQVTVGKAYEQVEEVLGMVAESEVEYKKDLK